MILSDLENHPFFAEHVLLQVMPITSRSTFLLQLERVQRLKAEYQCLARQCGEFVDISDS